MDYVILPVMIREGMASSVLPDDVETLKQLLIQKNTIITEKDAALSGKDTFIAELEKKCAVRKQATDHDHLHRQKMENL